MSLIVKDDSVTSKIDLVAKQLKRMEDTNAALKKENLEMKQKMNEILAVVQAQQVEQAKFKKQFIEVRRDYDLKTSDDKIISNYKKKVIENWDADRGIYDRH